MTFILYDTKLTIGTNGQGLLLSLAESHENNFIVEFSASGQTCG